MKKFLIFLVVFLLLIGGGVFAAVKMVPLEALKPQIQEKFHAATGRDLTITGDMRVTIWPDIGVKIGSVAISNAAWGKAEQMVSLDEMDVALKLMPLFEKRVEIDRFVLRAPHIYLETSKNGQNNWDIGPTDKAAEKKDAAQKSDGAAVPQDFDLRFGELKIIDGVLHFDDHSKVEKYAFDAINVTVTASDMDSPVAVDGKLQYRARQLHFNFNADKLSAVIAGKAFSGKIGFEADPFITTSLEGKFLQSADNYLTAAAETKIGDINGLLKWLSPTHSGEIPFTSLGFSTGKLQLGKAPDVNFGARLDNVTLKLDTFEMKGAVGFRQKTGAPPYIDADVALPAPLDVPALMARFAGGEETTAQKPAEKPQSAGWSTDVIDLSALHSMNGKFVLSHQGLIYKNLKSGAGKATVTLSGGKLVFDMPETTLDKGKLSAHAVLTEAGAGTALQIDLQSKDMPVQPLLIAFADVDKLTGAGSAYFNGTAKGNTQATLVSSLAGKAGFHLRDGMLHGVNFVDITKMVQKKLTNVGLGDGGTEFANFDATFAIQNGVMKNEDFYLRGPLVEAKGKGQIDLPQQTMKFRITPQMILKQAMQENAETGEKTLKTTGLAVPVDIYGPWTALKIKPDYAAVIQDALRDPEKIEENVKVIKEEVEKNLENLKGIEKELKNIEKPEDLLRGLLGQ
ncbi:MAG: AsmA family protein [Alphaproteobacteria bacterium]|nr:MAG: AsmA family protein [Alphaproteobacteria bacterium]